MKYLQNTKINKTITTTIFFILLFVFTTLAGAQTLVDFVPPTQNPPQANINPFDTGELSLPVCSSSQLLTFNSGSFTCVSDYKTQTEKNFAQNPDQNPDLQTPSFDDQGNLIEDYRFLCLSTQYFRGLRETSSGLYAVCELNSLIEIDENAVECPSGYVADGFDEGTVLTSRQIVCKKALEYAFNGLIGREKTLLSKLEIKDDCKTGYVLTKGDETTTDWHCGVNNISAEEEKIYFCSQNKTYKICKNDFDFVPFFNKTTQIFAVGSYGDTDGGGTAKGAVYIFERNLDGTLSQTFKISNNGGGDGLLNVYLDSNDKFGLSTSYSDNTLAVGASGDDNGGPDKGAVYIFEKDSSGEWEQTLKISDHGDGAEKLDINLDPNDNFGRSVLYLDNQLFVGAHADDDGGTDRGAVYVFGKDSNGDWEQTLKISDNGGGAGLLDINLDSHDIFGVSVNAYKDTLVVGAQKDDDGGTNKGAVYIFEKDSSGNWEKTLKISDNGGGAGKLDINLDNNDSFGGSVSYSDNTLVVGAVSDDNGGTGRGAVYIFEKDSSGDWEQTLKVSDNGGGPELLDIDLDDYDFFGKSVSYLDGTLVVGAVRDDDNGIEKGAAYIFEKDLNGNWAQTLKVSDNGGGDGLFNIDLNGYAYFGHSVSLSDI